MDKDTFIDNSMYWENLVFYQAVLYREMFGVRPDYQKYFGRGHSIQKISEALARCLHEEKRLDEILEDLMEDFNEMIGPYEQCFGIRLDASEYASLSKKDKREYIQLMRTALECMLPIPVVKKINDRQFLYDLSANCLNFDVDMNALNGFEAESIRSSLEIAQQRECSILEVLNEK